MSGARQARGLWLGKGWSGGVVGGGGHTADDGDILVPLAQFFANVTMLS